MKTAEEFVKEINASEELQSARKEIGDKAGLEAFLKANECGATAEQFAKVMQSREEGEIDDNAAEAASGGVWKLVAWLFDLFGTG